MTTNTNNFNPLKDFLQVLLVILFLASCFFALIGCASKKIPPVHTIEHKTDSTKITQINNAILDSLIVKVAKIKTAKPECDSITQATLDHVLSQLNHYKKSGNNQASVHYDQRLKQIVILLKQAQTQSQTTTKNQLEKEKEKEVEPIIIREKHIPLWTKILAFCGGLFLLFLSWRIGRIFI